MGKQICEAKKKQELQKVCHFSILKSNSIFLRLAITKDFKH